jgi:uncharacterized DUF497 family protein
MARFEWNGKVFEWDDDKAESNTRKHNGITFDEAVEVFDDPLLRLIFQGIVKGEERWLAVGMSDKSLLLVVVRTSDESADMEIVRIISARKLQAFERKEFEYGTRF